MDHQKKCVYAYTCITALAYRCATRHSAGGGGKVQENILFWKTTLTNFYIWGHFFQFGANLCGKILWFVFQGQCWFLGEIFPLWEILNLCFKRKFYFWGLFSVWAILYMGNLKSLYWGQIFYLRAFSNYMERLFFQSKGYFFV